MVGPASSVKKMCTNNNYHALLPIVHAEKGIFVFNTTQLPQQAKDV